MPRFPQKTLNTFDNMGYDNNEGNEVNADQLMGQLQVYMNQLLQFSPIVPNLFYVRDFLTCNRTQVVANQVSQGRSVLMNTTLDFDMFSAGFNICMHMYAYARICVHIQAYGA